MKRAVTSCAVVFLFLASAGRSVANVSMPFTESWSELEAVDNQSRILDAPFDLAAPVAVDGFWTPVETVSAADVQEGSIALSDSGWSFRPAISTRPHGYPDPGRELSPNTLAGLYFSNPPYSYIDLTDLGEISALDGLAFGTNLPSGEILLGGVTVGLIGWLWRRRNLSREEYP